jgi:hypothetical protein
MARPAMTATGIPTPIPTFAPIDKPPELADCEPLVAVEVLEGAEAVGDTRGVSITVVVAWNVVCGGSMVEAEASSSRSELCHQIGTPSPMTDDPDATVLVDNGPVTHPPAPLLVGNR